MMQTYEFASQDGVRSDLTLMTARTGGAYALLRGSLVAGVALRLVAFSLTDPADNDRELVAFTGAGAEFGVLWRPAYARYRASAVAVRRRSRSSTATTRRPMKTG